MTYRLKMTNVHTPTQHKKKRMLSRFLLTALLMLLLFCQGMVAHAQNSKIQGTVTEKDGKPIASAAITAANGKIVGITDENGNFTINAADGSSVTVHAIGYIDQTVVLHSDSPVQVVLEHTASTMEEVVVIGYGTQRRQNVTTSVSSIQGSALREVAVGNVTSALQGRLPGVVMTQTNSQPGANMQIRIRGTRSFGMAAGMNDPLIILDNIPYPGNIGDINPDDIKSIDILKDAAATAIYGSRGANGVIMITTNKGVAGQQARVTYSGYYGIETLFHRYPMMTGDELYKLRQIAGKFVTTDASGTTVPQLGTDEVQGQNTDWQKLMYKDGMIMNHNISVAGGTEKTTYSFGAGYFKQTSLLPDQDYRRISLRGAIDQKIGKYIQLGFTTNDNFALTDGQSLSLTNVLALSPLINPYNADGSWKVRGSSVNDPTQWLYSRASTEGLGDNYADNQKTFGSYNSLYGIVKIPGVDGLSYRINLGLNYWTLNRGQYQGVGIFSNSPTSASTASLQQQNNTDWTVENLLTYDKRINKHHINLTGLYSSERTQQTQSLISATNVLASDFQYYNLGQVAAGGITIDPSQQYLNVFGLESWMGRAMYDYDNRYMLSVAYRGDGSSRLAPGHKWHSYPAISAGWNITREQFMENVHWIDNLKLRVGWGQTSNQSVFPYQTLGQLASSPYNFGTQMSTGYYVQLAPNPSLGWEYSKTWNFGLDFGFLHNRLTGSIDYYLVNTHDILYTLTLPATAGITQVTANVGSSRNQGLELALNGSIIANQNGWSWDLGVNFTANKNTITALSSGVTEDVNNYFFVGHPINVVYDYQKIGIWQQNDPYLTTLEPGGNVGMVKVKYTGGYNDDGTPKRAINADDRQIMQVDPKWQGGFNTRVAYKNWDLTVLGIYQHGGLLISGLYGSNSYLDLLSGRRGQVEVNYWTPDNTGGTYPLPGGVQSGDNPKYASSLAYFSGSYLKVSTMSLGYNFTTAKWIQDLGVQRARVYFSVQNAFVLFSPYTKQSGLDPVANSFANQNTAVTTPTYGRNTLPIVGSNTPSTRNFLVGLNLSF